MIGDWFLPLSQWHWLWHDTLPLGWHDELGDVPISTTKSSFTSRHITSTELGGDREEPVLAVHAHMVMQCTKTGRCCYCFFNVVRIFFISRTYTNKVFAFLSSTQLSTSSLRIRPVFYKQAVCLLNHFVHKWFIFQTGPVQLTRKKWQNRFNSWTLSIFFSI